MASSGRIAAMVWAAAFATTSNAATTSSGVRMLAAPTHSLPHYFFSMSRPPLLKDYLGTVYSIPDSQLQSVAGTASWDEHTSVPAPGGFLNTDRHITIVHRYYWILSDPPVRYATDLTYDVKTTSGYTKTDKEETEKNLGISAGAKVFGISLSAQASLKITTGETQEWHEQTDVTAHQTFKANYVYCTWVLNDALDTTVDTRVSTDPVQQPAAGNKTSTTSTFRNIAFIYGDDVSDPVGKVLSNAVNSYGDASSAASYFPPRQHR